LKKEEDAEKFTEKAIEILESTKGKTTEDYALLGMLKNYQINFSGWLATIKLSNQAKTMAQKAIELDGDTKKVIKVDLCDERIAYEKRIIESTSTRKRDGLG
jgi:hypothetical protein